MKSFKISLNAKKKASGPLIKKSNKTVLQSKSLGKINNSQNKLKLSKSPKSLSSKSSKLSKSSKPSEFDKYLKILKREFQFFISYIKKTKQVRILLIISSVIYLLGSLLLFLLLPLGLAFLFHILFTLIFLSGFFLEIYFLKKQFLVGIFLIDFFYTYSNKIWLKIKKTSLKVPKILKNYPAFLRFVILRFKRITKTDFAKLSESEQKKYLAEYNAYVLKLKKFKS